MPAMTIGTAEARREEISTGWFDAVDEPTGSTDRFPVMIGQGKHDGPVMWVTASIHGGEHTGLIAAQRFLSESLLKRLRGTVVVVPTLNPAGLRTKQRSPYYYSGDPNRLFPEPPRHNHHDEEAAAAVPSQLEQAYRALYDAIGGSGAVALLDLHNAQIGSLPVVFRDPVFYFKGRGRGRNRQQAAELQQRVGGMLAALGFTVVNEFAADSYVSRNLHRSVSGSVLNGLGIPSATIELGSWMHVDSGVVEACLAGLHNVLRWADMLDGEVEPISGIPVIEPGYPVRRHQYPSAPHAGISQHLVKPGDFVSAGQPLVRMTDIFGQAIGPDDGLLRSEFDGYVIALQNGVVRYQGEAIMVLAIRDSSDLVVAYPY